uniref:cyclin-dependent kinase n=1 Tax=Prasinoderma coloniale TaxID=156133 RepID=A0A7R9TX12_9VIRI|mmetsp:Transcript_7986/g.32433  ORF Transcript_7986/g.32433 Transcript_7986/m.32433 type:complete len:511 (+) Transcript_7986:2-1534(+)
MHKRLYGSAPPPVVLPRAFRAYTISRLSKPGDRFQRLFADPPGTSVYRGRDRLTGRLVAIKCAESGEAEGLSIGTVRELGALRHLQGCPSVVKLHAAVDMGPRVRIVFERMDTNLRQPPREWIIRAPEALLKAQSETASKKHDRSGTSNMEVVKVWRDMKEEGMMVPEYRSAVTVVEECAPSHPGAGGSAPPSPSVRALRQREIGPLAEGPAVEGPAVRMSTFMRESKYLALHAWKNSPEFFQAAEELDEDQTPPSLDEDVPLYAETVRMLMWQLLLGVEAAHSRATLHRDIKPDNLLVERRTGRLVIAGWGLSRQVAPPVGNLTHEVVTLWYRAPEILLGGPKVKYSMPIDMWSVGAVFGELAKGAPLFPSENIEIDQLFHIFRALGTPSPDTWAGVEDMPDYQVTFPQWEGKPLSQLVPQLDEDGIDLLGKFLAYDPTKRISARDALAHPYFNGVAGAGNRSSWRRFARCRDVTAEALCPTQPAGGPTPPQEVDTKGILGQPAKTRRS